MLSCDIYECKRLVELEGTCEQCDKTSSCKSYLAIHVNINNSTVLHISYSAKVIDSEDPNYTSYSLIHMKDQDSSVDSNEHANPEIFHIHVKKEVGPQNQCTLFNVMHANYVFTQFLHLRNLKYVDVNNVIKQILVNLIFRYI